MSKLPLCSIVIMTKNRAESLARTLKSLQELTYPNYEIIVVNNASTDNTEEVISQYPVKQISSPEANISLGRQRGVEASQGEIIAMCDDDCVPASDWLNCLVEKLLSNEKIALVGGQVINIGFPEKQRYKGRGKFGRNGILKPAINPEEADYFGSANMAFRRSIFDSIGGYDLFFTNAYEEVDLILRFRKAGYETAYENKASVEHYYTGVSYNLLHLFFGGILYRIYFYLKHFAPQTLGGWLMFLAYEIFVLAKDLFWGIRSIVTTTFKAEFQWLVPLIWMFNSITARLAIPWLLWQANHPKQLTIDN